jgi:Protein of unknown function (DUF3990)
VNLALCRPWTDFGQGFYVTTNQHQARQWANTRVDKLAAMVSPPSPAPVAAVLQFRLERDTLADLESLAFVLGTHDFWALVSDCRGRFPPHQRPRKPPEYDVVYGPVTLWPQILLIQDCDQISFHTTDAVASLLDPVLLEKANDSDPKRTKF